MGLFDGPRPLSNSPVVLLLKNSCDCARDADLGDHHPAEPVRRLVDVFGARGIDGPLRPGGEAVGRAGGQVDGVVLASCDRHEAHRLDVAQAEEHSVPGPL